MGEYDKAIATARRLIAAKGEAVTLERWVDDASAAPGNPLAVVNAVDPDDPPAFVSPGEFPISFVKFPIAGSTDQSGLISSVDVPDGVLVGDLIRYGAAGAGAVRWSVVEAVPLAPGADVIIWKVKVQLWPTRTQE